MIIGIRREDKNRWERRAPLIPEDIARLMRDHGLRVVVQPSAASPARVFPDHAYEEAGAILDEDLSRCDLVLGVKEMPPDLFRAKGAYLFFSHTMKAQAYNMPMLKTILDHGSTLLDYELITDDSGRRLVFFGHHAGLAGMIDTLAALGQRLKGEGIESPLQGVGMAHEYESLDAAKLAIGEIGTRIAEDGFDPSIAPVVVGFAGYGNVSKGAQEVFDVLPHETITPGELASLRARSDVSRHVVYKVVFGERNMAARTDGGAFDLSEYFDHPDRYEGVFARHVPHLTALVNAIYWTEAYPRLVTRDLVRKLFTGGDRPHLRVIGDISCDIDGSIELTVKSTTSDEPCFVYHPATDTVSDGIEGEGIVLMAVDNLPCELPLESSRHFSHALGPFIAELAPVDLSGEFDALPISNALRRAVIVYQGSLRPEFDYLSASLPD